MGANLDLSLSYGRAHKTQRVFDEKPTSKGTRISLVGALSLSGIETAFNFEGTMTGGVFLYFIEHFLCPHLKPNQVVVMDNATAHKVQGVQELIEKTGAKLIYLPPYSPEFNPIELAWNKIKPFLRKQQARTKEELYQAYSQAIKTISEMDSSGFFKQAMSFVI